MTTARLSGTGHYLPKRALTNHDLEKMVNTSDAWIQQRVGIQSRHIANEHETNLLMSTEAAKQALEAADLVAEQINLIIVATSTADNLMPSQASQVQAALGIPSCPAFDVSAACSGFIYALGVAEQFFKAGSVRHALVIGTERMSHLMDWTDRNTCVLFGDGAGAVVLSASETPGIIGTKLHSDGTHRELLYAPRQFSTNPLIQTLAAEHLSMEGKQVFRHAVSGLSNVVIELLEEHGIAKHELDWLVPHQANERIIQSTAKKLGMSMDQVILTLATHGNTSAASVPLALDIGIKDGRIQPNQLVLLEAFGAGFVWGACLIRV